MASAVVVVWGYALVGSRGHKVRWKRQCSQIIKDELFKITMAIFQAVLEFQGDE